LIKMSLFIDQNYQEIKDFLYGVIIFGHLKFGII